LGDYVYSGLYGFGVLNWHFAHFPVLSVRMEQVTPKSSRVSQTWCLRHFSPVCTTGWRPRTEQSLKFLGTAVFTTSQMPSLKPLPRPPIHYSLRNKTLSCYSVVSCELRFWTHNCPFCRALHCGNVSIVSDLSV